MRGRGKNRRKRPKFRTLIPQPKNIRKFILVETGLNIYDYLCVCIIFFFPFIFFPFIF